MKAIISVFDKTGVVEFAKALHGQGREILATEGTARTISARGTPVTRVSEFTGSPVLLDGKVKTLHPRIHAAIATGEMGFVVVNLIPLDSASTSKKPPLDRMDIGGVALLRNGIKNFEHVVVVVDPSRYNEILEELRREGTVTRDTKLHLAKEALEYLRAYDSKIAGLLERME